MHYWVYPFNVYGNSDWEPFLYIFVRKSKLKVQRFVFGDVNPKDAMVLSCLYKYDKHLVLFENWVP